jgi:hypothetical protein
MPKPALQTIRPSRMTQMAAPGAPRTRIVSVMKRLTDSIARWVDATGAGGWPAGGGAQAPQASR